MKKHLYLAIFLFQAIEILLSSCVNQKQIAYFQKNGNQSDTVAVAKAYIPKIQVGDILSIPITSLNNAASSFFNPLPSGSSSDANGSDILGGTSSPAPSASMGYLVDPKGIIEMPLIGEVHIAGLTTSDARDTIKRRLMFYLKEPTVNVRFVNYKVSVMGEVARPAVYVVPNEKVTITEALSMAGDLTIFAKRNNVMVIRDNNGKKEFGRVNLNSREIFASPYYYLHSGDLVYVEPGKGKITQSDQLIRIVPIVITALTLAALVFFHYK